MFRKKKGKIRKQENELLIEHLEKSKALIKQKEPFLKNGLDNHQELIYQTNLEKAKYLFLLKEARHQHVGVYE